MKPKTRLENGVRVNIADNTLASPSTDTQAKALANLSTAITLDDLKPVKPMTAPVQPPNTGATSLLGAIESSTNQFTENLKLKREAAQKPYEDIRSLFADELAGQKGEVSRTAKEYSREGGVDTIQTELDDINTQIRNEQRALTNELRRLEKNPQGLFGGALNDAMDDAERKSLQKQADLSVIQQGIQGRFDSAKAIADRAVAAQLEGQKNRLNTLQFLYSEYKDDFTKAEQREFETAQNDRERALNREEEQLKQISDLSISALENGASPATVTAMRNAKSVTEALSIGGGYIGLLARQSADRAAASADLARRKDLLELAALGDTKAMLELGIDPNAPDAEQKVKSQDEIARLDEEIIRVEAMLGNELGLQNASGAIRSPLASSFFDPMGGVAFNYTQYRDAKADFLSKANYVLTNLTTEKVTDLKNRGVAFTPMTDADIALIGRATGELEGYTIRDEGGKVVGFTSETGARDALGQVVETLSQAKEREFRKMISNTELSEIEDL